MHCRHPLPDLWLLTDERQGDALWSALARLPRGSGVILRHYSLPPHERHRLYLRVRRITRARRLMLLLSRCPRGWRADGVYGPHGVAVPVHTIPEIRRAERSGAAFVLLSPLFPTRTHPGDRTLGRVRFAALAYATPLPVIALGGVKAHHRRSLRQIGAHGWAGIDAFGD